METPATGDAPQLVLTGVIELQTRTRDEVSAHQDVIDWRRSRPMGSRSRTSRPPRAETSPTIASRRTGAEPGKQALIEAHITASPCARPVPTKLVTSSTSLHPRAGLFLRRRSRAGRKLQRPTQSGGGQRTARSVHPPGRRSVGTRGHPVHRRRLRTGLSRPPGARSPSVAPSFPFFAWTSMGGSSGGCMATREYTASTVASTST
jgi:hypothetical protein